MEQITPERVHLAKDSFEQLKGVIQTLPSKRREILIRSQLLGQTFQEISEATGWSTSDVFRQFNAALRTLREAVEGREDHR